MSANVTFAIRGNSLNAYRSFGGAVPANFVGTAVVNPNNTIPGMIGGQSIDMLGNEQCLLYPNGGNLPAGAAISILWRGSFADISDYQILWSIGGPFPGFAGNGIGWGGIQGLVFLIANNFRCDANSDTGAQCFNGNVSGAGPTINENEVHDFLFTWDGTANANAVNLYIDAQLVAQATAAQAFSSTNQRLFSNMIAIGANSGRYFCEFSMNEFVIFDAVVSATPYTGATRTSFVNCVAFDGQSNVDPGIDNVAAGVDYEIAGEPLVGVLNAVTNVLSAATLSGQSLNATLTERS